MGRHNDKPIGEVLHEYLNLNKKAGKAFHSIQIKDIWEKQMGSMIAGYTSKIFFKDGVLKIFLTSAPLKKELLMGKDKIIKIINDEVGSGLVQSVEIY